MAMSLEVFSPIMMCSENPLNLDVWSYREIAKTAGVAKLEAFKKYCETVDARS